MKPGEPDEIEKMFDRVALNYDFLNDFFSIGLHRVWKRKLISMLKPIEGEEWIDLCCGTGDITLLLSNYIGPSGHITGIDYAFKPLKIAKKKALAQSCKNITWLKQDALNTGLPSGSFDGVLIAYGLRNLSDPKAGLKEIHRLLRPGGKAGVLDFRSFDSASFSGRFQKFYLSKLVVPIASLFGLRHEYSYLEKSLKLFPKGTVQEDIALEVGFKKASFSSIAFNQMGILMLKA